MLNTAEFLLTVFGYGIKKTKSYQLISSFKLFYFLVIGITNHHLRYYRLSFRYYHANNPYSVWHTV